MSAPFSVIRSASSLFILATQSSTEFSSTQPTSTSKLLFRAVSFTYIIKSVHLFFSAALSTHHRKLIGAKKKNWSENFTSDLLPTLVPKNAPFDSDQEWRSRIGPYNLHYLLFSGIGALLCHHPYCFPSQSQTLFGTGPGRPLSSLQGGKTFFASFCASFIAGSRRAFLCVDSVRQFVCLSLREFWLRLNEMHKVWTFAPRKAFLLLCGFCFSSLENYFGLGTTNVKGKTDHSVSLRWNKEFWTFPLFIRFICELISPSFAGLN